MAKIGLGPDAEKMHCVVCLHWQSSNSTLTQSRPQQKVRFISVEWVWCRPTCAYSVCFFFWRFHTRHWWPFGLPKLVLAFWPTVTFWAEMVMVCSSLDWKFMCQTSRSSVEDVSESASGAGPIVRKFELGIPKVYDFQVRLPTKSWISAFLCLGFQNEEQMGSALTNMLYSHVYMWGNWNGHGCGSHGNFQHKLRFHIARIVQMIGIKSTTSLVEAQWTTSKAVMIWELWCVVFWRTGFSTNGGEQSWGCESGSVPKGNEKKRKQILWVFCFGSLATLSQVWTKATSPSEIFLFLSLSSTPLQSLTL